MGRILFTSDTHFGHGNVIFYCFRPFLKDTALGYVKGNEDVQAMDNYIIKRWNEVVAPGDHVYHLGDFAMGQNQKDRVPELRARLNGSITLVMGNHDKKAAFYLERGFQEAVRSVETAIDGKKLILEHVPMLYTDQGGSRSLPNHRLNAFDYMFCGHVHDHWERQGKVINVGVDIWDFTPRTLEELIRD